MHWFKSLYLKKTIKYYGRLSLVEDQFHWTWDHYVVEHGNFEQTVSNTLERIDKYYDNFMEVYSRKCAVN